MEVTRSHPLQDFVNDLYTIYFQAAFKNYSCLSFLLKGFDKKKINKARDAHHRSVFLHPRDFPNDGYYLEDHPSQVVSYPISKKPRRLFGTGPTTLFREPIKVMVLNPRSTSLGMILQDPQDPHHQDPRLRLPHALAAYGRMKFLRYRRVPSSVGEIHDAIF